MITSAQRMEFLLHEGGEFFGRIADRLRPFGFQPGQNLRAVDRLDRRFTKRLHDLRRRALRHGEAVPRGGLVARPAASAIVGRSGNRLVRWAVVTASGRSFPLSMKPKTDGMVVTMKSSRPPSRSVIAGPAPL